jgi:hypothetical protein
LLPVSGSAKQMRFTHIPAVRGPHSLVWVCPLDGTTFFISLLALICLWFMRKRLSGTARALLFAALLFPVVHISLLSILSDWILWPWYFYSSGIAFCAALIVLLGDETSPMRARAMPAVFPASVAAIFCFLYAAHIVNNTWNRPPSQRVESALFLADFASTHPGRYAMGDRAGFASLVLPYPLVQLEGLVMDRQFLLHIQRQDNLLDVLHEYRVNYYVGTAYDARAFASGCFSASEPYQAGKSAPHMRYSFCAPPVASHQTPIGIKTLIFDLGQP